MLVFPLVRLFRKVLLQAAAPVDKGSFGGLAQLQGHLHERVNGISLIRSFALEEHEDNQFAKQNNHFLQKALAHTRWNANTFSVVNYGNGYRPAIGRSVMRDIR